MTYFNTKSMATKFTFFLWRLNFHHNGNYPYDTQQNWQVAMAQHIVTHRNSVTLSGVIVVMSSVIILSVVAFIVMLIVVMLSVVLLNVVAPLRL
jgi:hypothetical protein